jgi:hypothetical protein
MVVARRQHPARLTSQLNVRATVVGSDGGVVAENVREIGAATERAVVPADDPPAKAASNEAPARSRSQ